MLPLTQCRAVSTHCGAMIVPEQVNEPLLNTAAAQGAEDTVLPPMIRGVGSAATAVPGTTRAPVTVAAIAAAARRMRMATPS
jgi:hypothetical protein